MKVSELTGDKLDYWVARANGWTRAGDAWVDAQGIAQYFPAVCYDPSRDWALAGPIIEKCEFRLESPWEGCPGQWMAAAKNAASFLYGPTALVATMRAFVASVYGAEVPDEGV